MDIEGGEMKSSRRGNIFSKVIAENLRNKWPSRCRNPSRLHTYKTEIGTLHIILWLKH
jgi:hypothetical protein